MYKQVTSFKNVPLTYAIKAGDSHIHAPLHQDVFSLDFDEGEFTYLTLSDGVNSHEIVKVVGLHGQGVIVTRGELGTTAQDFPGGACFSSEPTYEMWVESLREEVRQMVIDEVDKVVNDLGCGEIELIDRRGCCG